MFVCKLRLRWMRAVVLLRICLYFSYLKGIAAAATSLSERESSFFCYTFQAAAARHRVHETPEQSGQHRPCDCKSRHVNAGGEGLLQTKGKGLAALVPCPLSLPAPFLPKISPCLPGRAGKANAWPGAQRIPPAAARSDPTWLEEKPVLQAVPCVSLGPLSVQDKFRALKSRGLFLLPPLLLLHSGWFLLFWEVDGAAHRGWKTLPVQHCVLIQGKKMGGFAELSWAKFMGKARHEIPLVES